MNNLTSLWDININKISQSGIFSNWYTPQYLFVLLFFIPIKAKSQTSQLQTLIAQYQLDDDAQTKVDSFLSFHKDMPSDSLADCHHEIGRRLYYSRWRKTRSIDNLDKAIKYTSQAVELKINLVTKDSLSIQKSLFNLARFYILGDYHSNALSTYRDLVDLKIHNPKTYNSFIFMSQAYIYLGDYYSAKDILIEGIDFISMNESSKSFLAEIHYELAACYSNLGFRAFSKEIQTHLQLSKLAADQSDMDAKDKNDLQIVSIFLNGNRLLRNEKYREALTPLNQSLKNTAEEDSLNLAIAHNSLGLTHLKLNEFEKSRYHLNKSIAYSKQYSPPYENLGDYFLIQKEYVKGLQYYQKAIAINLKSNPSLDFNDLPSIEELKLTREKFYVLSHLIQKAVGWKKYYEVSMNQEHLLKSLSTFQLADKLIDEIRIQSMEDKSKLFWQEKGHSLYLNAVELCHILNKPKLAYYFMEKNKALLLLGDASSKNHAALKRIPTEITDKEIKLKRQINLLEDNYSRAAISSSSSIKQNIIKVKDALYSFIDSIHQVYPDYARAKHRVDILPYLDFTQDFTSDKKAVIHYISSDSIGYGLLNTSTQNILFPISPFEDFSNSLHDHLFNLRAPISDNNDFDHFCTNAKKLYDKLFPGEVTELIEGKSLTIIPDSKIQQLPFESLVNHLQPLKYLISTSDINYQYSISYVTMNKGIARAPEKNFIALAPRVFEALNLPSLPYSYDEVKGINKNTRGDLLLEKDASKDIFLSNLKDYKAIHLSTHASSGDSLKPWIAFEDGKIYLDELNSTTNHAEMVTLSACNTSIGEYKNGEGALSLARSFFYSGANSVVASLWSTNDKSSKELMVEFYNQLSLGNSKSNSLQEAKLQYLKNNSGSALSPYYWASTIVIGNNETISFKTPWHSNIILLSILLILFALISFLVVKAIQK